jgi:soluble lytic murein transglycosylase
LPPRLRCCLATLIAALVFVVTGVAARAANGVDGAALAAVAAARAGNWSKADLEAAQSKDTIAAPLVRWLDFTRAGAGSRFSDIAGFITRNPDWPLQKVLRRRAEGALSGESDDTAAAWFKDHPPISGVGMVRAAVIMLARGQPQAGIAALRRAWIEGDFAPLEERAVIERFGALLRPEDDTKRLTRLLWDGQSDAARRMLPLVSADDRAVAEARLALAGDAPDAVSVVARVPVQLRTDPGLAFDEALWWHKRGNFDNAAQLLLAHSDDPVYPSSWWKERLLVARHLLAHGNADMAYRLVQLPAALTDRAGADAAFVSGLIALDFHRQPAIALNDFTRILDRTTDPYARSRAAYWAGRAAATADNPALAAKWFAVGAENPGTFYGQLSASKLGKEAPPAPAPDPRPDTATQAHFDAEPLVRAAELLLAANDYPAAGTFVMKMAKSAKSELDFAMLGSLAEAHGRFDLAIAVARRAIDAGMPLMLRGYPITRLPAGSSAERPLLLAIVRQESGFSTGAISSVGARGLMQLMPATALRVAHQDRMAFSLARLSTDGVYNITLGRSYIETLLDDFGGVYPLAIAAYNAGPGRVHEWLQNFGDPRDGGIKMVDWIEMIPFNETRNYVQRVLENLQIYREQAGDATTAFPFVAELSR